jgi:uncharacterized membrane protein (DUF106 family)
VWWVNAALGNVFDGILYPFRTLPPLIGLCAVSLLCAIGMLLAFRATSDQKGIEQVKRRMHACLFEMRLFNDDVVALFRAQAEMLRHNARYLRLSAVPILWVLPPLVLVMAQLQTHYGYRALRPDESALVKVKLAHSPAGQARPQVELRAPADVEVQSPAIWLADIDEVVWRVAIRSEGTYELAIRVQDQTYSKSLSAESGVRRRSPLRTQPDFVDQLLYPAEVPLAQGGPVSSISVNQPTASISIFGWDLPWIVIFFVLTIVFAFALRNPLGVTI